MGPSLALEADGSETVAHLIHSNLSLCFFKMDRYDDALRAAERAVELKPEWHKAWSRKAAALETLGRTQDALVAVRQALTLEPGNGEYRNLALKLKGKLAVDPVPAPRLTRPTCRSLPRYDPPEGKGDNLLVLLHGLGDNPSRFLEFGQRLQVRSKVKLSMKK
jgi:tetratricopeptide (TPR) repeat protein